MAAPFDIIAFDHIVLRAADPAALERFYLDVLGLTFETRQGKLAQLRAGSGLIDSPRISRLSSPPANGPIRCASYFAATKPRNMLPTRRQNRTRTKCHSQTRTA